MLAVERVEGSLVREHPAKLSAIRASLVLQKNCFMFTAQKSPSSLLKYENDSFSSDRHHKSTLRTLLVVIGTVPAGLCSAAL